MAPFSSRKDIEKTPNTFYFKLGNISLQTGNAFPFSLLIIAAPDLTEPVSLKIAEQIKPVLCFAFEKFTDKYRFFLIDGFAQKMELKIFIPQLPHHILQKQNFLTEPDIIVTAYF